jgi:hypothetical protein
LERQTHQLTLALVVMLVPPPIASFPVVRYASSDELFHVFTGRNLDQLSPN